MLKKTISYEDFDGNTRTEDFYFHLSEAELTELELTGEDNSLAAQLVKIAASSDGREIIDTFKKVITLAYGERGPNGTFYKEDDNGRKLYRKFIATGAYSHLFMELATSAEAGAAFMNGIVPAKLAEAAKKEGVEFPAIPQPAPAQDDEAQIADEDLLNMDPQKMTQEQLLRAFKLKSQQ